MVNYLLKPKKEIVMKVIDEQPDQYLSMSQVAEILFCDEEKVEELCEEYDLETEEIDGESYLNPEDILGLIIDRIDEVMNE